MAGMNASYRNAIADNGNPITHIGLVDETGTEIAGGDPAYSRLPVTWGAAVDGTVQPTEDLLFDIPPSTTVAGWRGYNALSAGTDHGGKSVANETYTGQGTYRLRENLTGISHDAAA